MMDVIPFVTSYVEGQPGFVLGLPAEAYHAAPGVSQTMLSKLARSPAHLQAWLASERKQTPSQVFGTLAHLALFEPDRLRNSHYVKPEGMKFSTKEGNAWKAEHADLPIIDREEWISLKGICDSAHSHHYGCGLLEARGVAEVSAFCGWNNSLAEATIHGIRSLVLKARIDRIVQRDDGKLFILDAKTTEDASPDGFRHEIEKWGYFRQAAFYLDVCRSLGVDIEDFYWLAVEKEPPYAVGVYRLSEADIEVGRRLYRRELDVYAECVRTNKWPAYSSQIETLELRKWVREAACPE